MKLIHVSDPHLVAPPQTFHGVDPFARLEACLESINSLHSDAELVVFSGDIGHDVDTGVYRLAAERLATLKPPWKLVPGNHDNREKLRAAFPELAVDRNGYLQSIQATPEGVVICLDTLRQREPHTGHGRLCRERVAWLANRLDEFNDQPVYIFMHHQPLALGTSIDAMDLTKPERLVKTLAGRTNVRHLFFGHTHRASSGSWLGIPFSSAGSITIQMSLDFGPDAPMRLIHEPPSYAVALIDEDSVVVHNHQFLETEKPIDL